MRAINLKKHIKEKNLSPCYFIHGEDDFLILRAKKQFASIVEGELNLTILQHSKEQEVIEAASLLPFCEEHRVVISEDFMGDFGNLVGYLKNPNPSTVLVFIAKSLPKTKGFDKIKGYLEFVDCAKLYKDEIKKYIFMFLENTKTCITEEAIDKLIFYCLSDMGSIQSELEKLIAYKSFEVSVKSSKTGIIDEKSVEELVTKQTEHQAFLLGEAIAKKDFEATSEILACLKNANEPPVKLMGMLYNFFRRLQYIAITENQEALHEKFGIKPYAVKKLKELSFQFSKKQLVAICDSFHKLDLKSKSGTLPASLALDLFVLKAMSTVA